jgi:hypothetical protein
MEKSRNKFGAKAQSGALSGRKAIWQSCCALGLAGIAAFCPGTGRPEGPALTVRRGEYGAKCPARAGLGGLHRAEEDFTIRHASIYSTSEGRGIYLLTGDVIRLTSGPRKGTGSAGSATTSAQADQRRQGHRLRCIRRVAN